MIENGVYTLGGDDAWLVYDALECYSNRLSELRYKTGDLMRVIGDCIDPREDEERNPI